MRDIEEVQRQTTEVSESEVDSGTMGSNDDSQTRPSVFRRVMARDLYDLTRRLKVLEQHSGDAGSVHSKTWSNTVPVLIFLMLFAGSILYIVHRVDSGEELQREETNALRNELESKQYMIDELHQIVRQQARSQRAIAAAAPLARDRVATAAVPVREADTLPNSAPVRQRPLRASLPASLEPGEVLLIVASTPIKEEALDLAQALERDGHASEVVLGLIGYYGVALGRFEFEQAERMKTSMVESAPENPAPYLMPERLIDSYVYP